jgi:hypothetical protein
MTATSPDADVRLATEDFRIRLVRGGVLLWPIAAALKLAGQYGTFFSIGYGTDDRIVAGIVDQPRYLVGMIGGAILPTVLSVFGVAALFLLLLPTPGRRAATVAGVACVLGLASVLPALGVLAFALPRIGDAFLTGRIADFSLATGFFLLPWLTIFVLALLYPVGSIVFGLLLARHTAAPTAPAWLFGFSGVFLALPLPVHSARVAGAVLLLVAGLWMARSVRRATRSVGTLRVS